MCELCGAGGACTVGGDWNSCGNPTLREARGFSLRRDFAGLLGALKPPLVLCACEALLKKILKHREKKQKGFKT